MVLFVMITKVQRRLRTLIRVLVALLVLGILVPQFFSLNLRFAADIPKEERPTGQPLRVENRTDPPLMDQFVVKWKEWTKSK